MANKKSSYDGLFFIKTLVKVNIIMDKFSFFNHYYILFFLFNSSAFSSDGCIFIQTLGLDKGQGHIAVQ